MPINCFQYALKTETLHPEPPIIAYPSSLSLDVREWIWLQFPHGGEIFAVFDEPVDQKDRWQQISTTLQLPEETCRNYQLLIGPEAIMRFLSIVTGIGRPFRINGSEPRVYSKGKALMESFHTTYSAMKDLHVGPIFSRLFQRGIWLHEKARQETEFFRYAISPPAICNEISTKVLGSLAHRLALISGTSPMIPRITDRLRQSGCDRFMHLNTNGDANGSEAPPLRKLEQRRLSADILFLFPGSDLQQPREFIRQRMKARHASPLLVFDYAGCGLDEKQFRKMSNLYVYTAADIESVSRRNIGLQNSLVSEIESWLDREVTDFYDWYRNGDIHRFAGIIGATPSMQRVFEMISRIARTDITVLIDGESGTGKELVAKAIHQLSTRADQPFVTVNCGAIPENLLESELFGHVRGAFTGAVSAKPGLFETADKGTIFLDEIAELPTQLQVKLLRVLQEGDIKRVGGNDTTKVDVRVLAATNKLLSEMVDRDEFRSDLYYRLNVIQVTIPALRQRSADIPLLAENFMKTFAQQLQKGVYEFSAEAMRAIQRHSWPGNVRELENAVERAVAMSVGRSISIADLPPGITAESAASTDEEPAPLLPEAGKPGGRLNRGLTLEEVEKQHIIATLDSCDWNHSEASRQLGISRTTLWRKLREYELDR